MSLAAAIEERLGIQASLESTNRSGQFDVLADGSLIASRGGNPLTRIFLGAGFPVEADVVAELEKRRNA